MQAAESYAWRLVVAEQSDQRLGWKENCGYQAGPSHHQLRELGLITERL